MVSVGQERVREGASVGHANPGYRFSQLRIILSMEKLVDRLRTRLGCVWSPVQIRPPRPRELRPLSHAFRQMTSLHAFYVKHARLGKKIGAVAPKSNSRSIVSFRCHALAVKPRIRDGVQLSCEKSAGNRCEEARKTIDSVIVFRA